ncbi:secreted protein [Candidatus Magnetoovum chiemensis]|nr:secreted protein [Candidatus Magnetoovum chiemensis]
MLISIIRFILLIAIIIPPLTASDPPVQPEPFPLGITGILFSEASERIWETSIAELGKTTASGIKICDAAS